MDAARTPRKRPLGTLAIWLASLLNLLVAGVIATEFGFMATSLDPTEMVNAGVEPWSDALVAAAAFAGLLVATVLGLALWHTARFKAVALILTAGEIGAVAWACVRVYQDYF